MLYVVLAEAEVELAPESVAGHPAIRAMAKDLNRKPTEVLLDQNMHHQAIRQLPDGERRGRPDIVHYTLLALLESPLNKEGRLQVLVQTRNGELIRFKPDTRLPRGEARFQGLLSKVLREGASQDKQPLVWVEEGDSPAKVLRNCQGPIVRLDEGAAAGTGMDVARHAKDGDLTVVLGAFPSGQFGAPWMAAVPNAVSVFAQPLNAWAVAAEVVTAFRFAHPAS